MDLLTAAVELGQRGFRVHPCRPQDKRPLTRWTQTATTDPDSIAAMWRRWPTALIAVRTGDGLVVVDDDRGRPEPDPSLPATVVASTRSRGWHHWYASDAAVGNSVGILPGIDVRGQGGYVIAPPSPGWRWRMPIGSTPLAPLPELFRVAVARRTPAGGARFEIRDHVPAGERHGYLVSYAGWAVKALELDDLDALTEELVDHALVVCEPWEAHELDGVRRHLRQVARWVLEREQRD